MKSNLKGKIPENPKDKASGKGKLMGVPSDDYYDNANRREKRRVDKIVKDYLKDNPDEAGQPVQIIPTGQKAQTEIKVVTVDTSGAPLKPPKREGERLGPGHTKLPSSKNAKKFDLGKLESLEKKIEENIEETEIIINNLSVTDQFIRERLEALRGRIRYMREKLLPMAESAEEAIAELVKSSDEATQKFAKQRQELQSERRAYNAEIAARKRDYRIDFKDGDLVSTDIDFDNLPPEIIEAYKQEMQRRKEEKLLDFYPRGKEIEYASIILTCKYILQPSHVYYRILDDNYRHSHSLIKLMAKFDPTTGGELDEALFMGDWIDLPENSNNAEQFTQPANS